IDVQCHAAKTDPISVFVANCFQMLFNPKQSAIFCTPAELDTRRFACRKHSFAASGRSLPILFGNNGQPETRSRQPFFNGITKHLLNVLANESRLSRFLAW